MMRRLPTATAALLTLLALLCLVPAAAQAQRVDAGGFWSPRLLDVFAPSLRGWVQEELYAQWTRTPQYAGNSVLPGPEDPRRELHVIVIADLNSSYGSTDYRADVHRAVDEIIARRPDVVLTTGDMVAGQRSGLDYRAMWQSFHEAVTWRLQEAGIPFLITPGNHDGAGTPRFAHEREVFIDEWTLHRPKVDFVDDTHYPARYSATVGPVFFVSLDATTIGPLRRDQMEWLDAQLERAANYPIKIVFGHVPLYASAGNKAREIIGDPALEELFNRHGVQAYISGHHHTYYPGARGDLRLVSMPCLGSGLRRLISSEPPIGPRGFVEFVAAEGGLYDLDAWRGPNFTEVIDRSTLPAKVGLAGGPLVRDDLLGLDLRSQPLRIAKGDGSPTRFAAQPERETPRGATRPDSTVSLPADIFE